MVNEIKNDAVQAVIVLYNCSPQKSPALLGLYKAMANFKGKLSVLLYDNSPNPATNLPALPGLNITYLHDLNNSGIGKAYNVAAKMAIENQQEWLLLLDQDTAINTNFLSFFQKSKERYSEAKVFAPLLLDKDFLVSPFRYSGGRGKALKRVPQSGIYSFNQMVLANSGLFVRADLFKQVGGYTEELRLDFSDIDFCLKLQKAGENFVIMDGAVEHSLSGLRGGSEGELLMRFSRYTKSAVIFARLHNLNLKISLRLAYKAVMLSLKYRQLHFLKIYYNNYLKKRDL